jgi:hypothetical protein
MNANITCNRQAPAGAKDKPVLLIFVSEMTRPGFGLLKLLDKYGRLRQPDGLEVLIVRVTDDAAGAAKQSKVHFDQYDIKSTAGVARGGKVGPWMRHFLVPRLCLA